MTKAELDQLVEQARKLPLCRTIPVPRLPREDQQYLVSQGISFSTDRMGKPVIGYSQRQRAEDLRQKVLSKRAGR